MHMDRAEGNQKPRVFSPCGPVESPSRRNAGNRRPVAPGDARPIRPARAASVSAEPAQAYPNRDPRGNNPGQGVREFSQVFGTGYRVRVDWKSPAESCLPADMGPAIAPTAILGYG